MNMPPFDLGAGRIEVWCIDTAAQGNSVRQLESVLSVDERERAYRFHFERHRGSFIVVRGMLRLLVGRYTGTPAAEIAFAHGPNGKPSVAGDGVQFNLSHTDGAAVLAFARDCALGVDVECIRPMENLMQLARRFFNPLEAAQLSALPESTRARSFFLCWTRKEAYIKATGNGLSTPLSAFCVTLQADEPAHFVDLGRDTCVRPSEWMLHNLEISDAHAGAIAYCGEPRALVQSPLLPIRSILQTIDIDR
jgi:4'-phosphopantetheinyl transferase